MIIDKENIVCFVNCNRIYFVQDGKLFWAFRKQGTHRTHGTRQNLRRKITIRNDKIHEIGLVEESFLNAREN